MKKAAWIVFIAAVLLAGGGAVFFAWRGHVIKTQRGREEQTVQTLLDRNQGREALALLQLMRRETAGDALSAEQETRWKKWELQAAGEIRDVPRLLMFYERDPALMLENESASVMAARGLLAIRRPAEAAKLRASWRGREQHREDWLAYDADECLHRGKPDEARALLLATTLPGKADCARLLRLAILSAGRPQDAVKYFNAAYAADPHNPDLRSFRAQILENAGQPDRARVEYTAAVAADTANPLLRDQLAEFYLRQQNYPLAVQTLAENLGEKSFDFMWVKALFWGKLSTPLPQATAKCTPGNLQPLAEMMSALPPGAFWDEAAFQKLRLSSEYAASREEVNWLRLLQNLQTGKEKEALEILSGERFKTRSRQPELASALRIVLKYRKTGQNPQPGDFISTFKEHHALFDAVAAWSAGKPAPEIQTFAAGPYAFAGVCLAAGWTEAALNLAPSDRALPDAPEWFRYGMVQALRLNRDNAAALAFAQKQPASPLLQLAVGELQVATGARDQGWQTLKSVAADTSDAGYRAAWMLAMNALEQNKPAEALGYISAQPRLAASVTGREIAARAAALSGDQSKAVQLYSAMEKESAEAKVFLARRAFAAKQWEEARRLTRELMAQYPDQLSFREELLKIDRAAALK